MKINLTILIIMLSFFACKKEKQDDFVSNIATSTEAENHVEIEETDCSN